MKKVYTYFEQVDALNLQHLLEAEGIPVKVHSNEDWGMDGILRAQVGMGAILVPEQFEQQAQHLVEEYVKDKKQKQEES